MSCLLDLELHMHNAFMESISYARDDLNNYNNLSDLWFIVLSWVL